MFAIFKKNKTNENQTGGLRRSLSENVSIIKRILSNNEMLIVWEFQNRRVKAVQCCIIYIEGMVQEEKISENIIKPILNNDLCKGIHRGNLLEELKKKVIISNNVVTESNIEKLVSSVTYGDTLFFLEGCSQALIIGSKGWQARPISEPESSRVIRGPREGFTESILMNLTMLRRKIKDPGLKFKYGEIGKRTQTKLCTCYIEGLAKEGVLRELEKRLNDIDIDGIIDSGYIQEMIKDAPFSPFETIGSSERPDVIAAKLLEGRVALFVDGSPFVLTVPYVVAENFQANEDYYNNYILSSMNRLLRGLTAVTTIAIPAVYVSIVTYHQEMLPTPLLILIRGKA
jgi:spore germination protein KA